MSNTRSLHKSAKVFKENIRDVLGLTPLQEGLLFHYLESPGSNYYFEQLSIDISGEIDPRRFETAWNRVVRQNEMLRAVFRWEKVTQPVQLILKDHPVNLITYDLSGKSAHDKQFLVEEIKASDRLEGFDLREVPFRVILVNMEDSTYRMIVESHHILYDGWSSALILEEFFSAYGDLVNNRAAENPRKAGFKEYLKWLRDRDRGERMRADYWKEYLKGFEGLTELSVKRKIAPESKNDRMDSYRVKLPDADAGAVNRFLEQYRITLAGLFYTAWGLLLQNYNGTGDVTMGTTVSGRSAPIAGIERTVGLFINTLPLRLRARADENCLTLLHRVTGELRDRREYETTPLVKVRGYSPLGAGVKLFDTLVVMENYPLHLRRMQENSGLTIHSYTMFERTHYDLTVTVETFEGIGIDFGYKPCFDKETVVRLARHFERILQCIIENPDVPVNAVEILSEEEKHRVLYDFNDTDADYPSEKTVLQLFEEQAARFPDRIAFKGGARSEGEMTAVSYKELEDASRRTAFALGKKGIGPGTIAAVMLDRSPRLLIYIYAILKAGAAYLPIDPRFPDERKQYILEDSGAKILLTRDTEIDEIDEQASLFPTSLNLAYIIYTSGSTGLPKGVMIEHRSLVNRLVWMQKNYPLDAGDVVLHKTPITFDISVWELFWWGIAGASVCFLAPGAEKDPAEIVKTVQFERITVMHFVPSMLQSMLQYIEEEGAAPRLQSLRQVFSSGEALSYSQVKRFNGLLFTSNHTRLTNLYGPTEATIDVSRYDCSGAPHLHREVIPIGRPIDNIKLLILDRYRRLTPVGVPGELWIGGVGLARGYINNPHLTAKKFNRTYFSSSFYKTGDRVRWFEDGNIEFLGRFDFQIKIRGFRVEPVEIENQLLTHPMVKEAAVAARETSGGESGICAYIAPRDTDFTVCELKEYLSRRLPYYMVPSHFIALERLPMTPNGKLDRKSLPEPDAFRPPLKVSYTGPETEIEKKVAALWKDVLKLENVGVNDNFFDLGGHSLHIIRLTGRLKALFKKDVPVTTMFRCPTIRMLVDRLNEGTASAGDRRDRVPGQPHVKEIAVIGIALRFPGAATVETFWENLVKGVEAITFFPSPSPGDPRYVCAKGRLENSHGFDADFFEYTPREARLMDPQLRLLHRCVWEALGHAGYDPLSYKGLIGLYTGALSGHSRYEKMSPFIKNHSERLAVGSLTDRDFFSTRVAYKLNLRGPALTIQTACSTSLVAIDAACRALLNGDCDIAAAGGVSITHEDEDGYLYQEGMVRSPDGHCRVFDAKAGGTVGGNGAGIVVLKPLSAALSDRDTVYAVIKSSAVNNDGMRKVGFTAPGIEGQAGVVRAAHRKSGVSPESITYVEAHGTGTKLGDPVEIEALKEAFGTSKRQYCAVGSVKTNIGHLDAASGAAGFIKTVLALYHRVIPPSLHFERPNPSIDFENSPFYVNNRLLPWPKNGFPPRAGVSSFGIGGTNAHVILEAPPRNKSRRGRGEAERRGDLLLLSAKSENALDAMARDLAEHLKKNKDIDLGNVAYTLQVGRPAFKHRRAVVADSAVDAVQALTAPASPAVQSFTADDQPGGVIFMFPGQGAQYINMGAGLYRHEPLFRETLDRCFEILGPLTGGNVDNNIKEILFPPDSGGVSGTIHSTRFAQPVLFVFEYALARLLLQWGITPRAMIGHSIGEYAAACIAGVFSLEDGLRLVALRGKLMQQMPTGAMLAVSLPRKQLDPLLHGKMSVAAVNGPSSCVVSGPNDDIFQLAESLGKRGIENRMLHTSHAFHSPMMEPVLDEFESTLRTVTLKPPQIPYISNVTGTWITPGEAVDPHYWSTHLRKTVRMSDGLTQLLKEERVLLIEVGPGRVLSTFAHKHPGKKQTHEIVNLVRHPHENIDDLHFLLTRIGRMWGVGFPIDWERFNAHREHSRVPLPTYPFADRPYVLDTEPPPAPQIEKKEKKDIADWFYIPLWRQTPAAGPYPGTPPHPPRTKEPAACLVFTDTTPFNHRLTDRLKKMYRTLFQVKKGDRFQRRGKYLYTVHPGTYDHYRQLLKEIVETGIDSPLKIIHLWGVAPSVKKQEKGRGERTLFRAVEADLESGFFSLLHLARAIADARITGPVHIEVITADMQPVIGDEDLKPGRAPVLGPIKIIPLEYPDTRCRGIDIHPPASPGPVEDRLIENILLEIHRPFDHSVVAFRGNYRWVQEFEPLHIEPGEAPHLLLRTGGVYLITGGFGGMGFTFAEYLARTFQARLILVGRSPLTPGGPLLQKVGELEKLGAGVLAFNCDVSDHAGMKRVVRSAVRKFGPIDGVLHTAGIADYGGVIQRRTPDGTRDILAPKIKGTIVLDKILQEMEPAFIVLFSTIGNIAFRQKFGQVAYAAANEFLDAFSYYKTARGRTRFISINWSDWRERGMAVSAAAHWAETLSLDPRSHDLLENAIMPSEGIDAFLRILNQPFPRVAVSPESLSAKIETGAAAFNVLPALPVLPGDTRGTREIITETWQDFLRVENIGIHDNIFDLGASSLDVVQVNTRLKDALKREIPLVAMYTYPTIHSLTLHLEQVENSGGDSAEVQRVNEQIKGWDRSKSTFNRTLKKIRTPGQGKKGNS